MILHKKVLNVINVWFSQIAAHYIILKGNTDWNSINTPYYSQTKFELVGTANYSNLNERVYVKTYLYQRYYRPIRALRKQFLWD